MKFFWFQRIFGQSNSTVRMKNAIVGFIESQNRAPMWKTSRHDAFCNGQNCASSEASCGDMSILAG